MSKGRLMHGILVLVGAVFFVATLILWFTKDETEGAAAKEIATEAKNSARAAENQSSANEKKLDQISASLETLGKKFDNYTANAELINEKPVEIKWPTEAIPIQVVDTVRVRAKIFPREKKIPNPPIDPKTHPLLHRAGQAVGP